MKKVVHTAKSVDIRSVRDMSLFITFEGQEGSGKTTQIELLKQALQRKKYKVIITREPGGTAIGDQIRHILLDPKNKAMDSLTELLLYEASRAQHVAQVIRPALKRGQIVISDRYADASTVYQGMARQLGTQLVKHLNTIATQGLKPHLTIVLDCPLTMGLSRMKQRTHSKLDRIEKEEKSFHAKVRHGYLTLAKQEPHRVKIIDGSKTKDEVHQTILNLILKKL